jgi:hypothetical protein
MQNKSHAVMSQRIEPLDSADDFPTPPWATRALIEHAIKDKAHLAVSTCLEPACGSGRMSEVLRKYFGEVHRSDADDYGYASFRDFLTQPYEPGSFDWVITNPPFRLAEKFVIQGLRIARVGVAIFARTAFVEGVGRYTKIYSPHPPTRIAQFTERVPVVKGRLDQAATTATSYAWFVWEKGKVRTTELFWIPPCRKQLERPGDYDINPDHASRGQHFEMLRLFC